MEEQFQQAWENVTNSLINERAALGSRLHHAAEDDTFIAYAQWPTRSAWEESGELDLPDPTAAAAMREAIKESYTPVLMRPVRDHLVRK